MEGGKKRKQRYKGLHGKGSVVGTAYTGRQEGKISRLILAQVRQE